MSAFWKHKVMVTVLARKSYPELQEAYLAPGFKHEGPCRLFEDGQEFVFEKFNPARCGFPCMEAWDAISRYMDVALSAEEAAALTAELDELPVYGHRGHVEYQGRGFLNGPKNR